MINIILNLAMFLQAFEFERRIQNPNLQVDSMLKTSFAKQKAFNRAAIGHVIHTLKFIGELGIPFRGHRDSGQVEPVTEIKDIDTSTGNFRAISQLHAMGNPDLARFLKESTSNATCLSPDIQNELIAIIGEEILSTISSEVKEAPCFAVIADETTDKSTKSQLSIVVRYLKGDVNFNGALHCHDGSIKCYW